MGGSRSTTSRMSSGFVWEIVHRSRLELNHQDREELAAFLVAECWHLSVRYRRGTGSTTSFAGWATTTLRLRVVDWRRARFGRTRWQFSGRAHEREQPQLVSLDDPDHDQFRAALGTRAGDPAADRSPDLARLLGTGGGARARDLKTLGLSPPRRLLDEISTTQ
jgi:hypothetical protein